jgi:hypothetical protein
MEPNAKKLKSDIRNFFLQTSPPPDDVSNSQANDAQMQSDTEHEQEFIESHTSSVLISQSESVNIPTLPSLNDAGHLIQKVINKQHVSDEKIKSCLESRWTPQSKNEFPFSISGQKKLYLGSHYLTTYPWLAISQVQACREHGAYGVHFFTQRNKQVELATQADKL